MIDRVGKLEKQIELIKEIIEERNRLDKFDSEFVERLITQTNQIANKYVKDSYDIKQVINNQSEVLLKQKELLECLSKGYSEIIDELKQREEDVD